MSGSPEGIDAPRVEAWFEANVPEVSRRSRSSGSPAAGRT